MLITKQTKKILGALSDTKKCDTGEVRKKKEVSDDQGTMTRQMTRG